MGAMTALGFAVRAPERLRTLVVAGITPAREPRPRSGGACWTPSGSPATTRPGRRRWPLTIDAVQGPGAWRRLLPAIADDIAAQPLLTPASCARSAPRRSSRSATATRHAGRQALASSPPGPRGRLLVVPDCGHDVLTRRPAVASKPWAASIVRPSRSPGPSRRPAGGVPMTTLLALYRRPDGGPEALADVRTALRDGAPAAGRRHARPPRRRACSGSSRRSAARPTWSW